MVEFFLVWFFSWYAVGFLIGAALLSEYNECHGWTVICAAILMAVLFKLCELTSTQMLQITAAYVPIGFIWSFWRWKLYCNKVIRKFEAEHSTNDYASQFNVEEDKKWANAPEYAEAKAKAKAKAKARIRERLAVQLDPRTHVEKMLYWVAGWPFSMVERSVSDIIDAIRNIIQMIMKQTYERISAAVMKRVDATLDKTFGS